MSGADRRHAAASPAGSSGRWATRPTRPVLAAALLHDVGKVDGGLGTYGRVVATLSGAVGRPRHGRRRGSDPRRLHPRVGLYLQHPTLGGDLLALAGSDPLTVAWAREHHLPAEQWTVAARGRPGPEGRRRRLRRSVSAGEQADVAAGAGQALGRRGRWALAAPVARMASAASGSAASSA